MYNYYLFINMQYCKECIIPSTRPDQYFDENGVCGACISYKTRRIIDWNKREKKFFEIINKISIPKNKWNCIIPSSGGKDSTFQALKCRELGLNPLIVTASTCDLSIVGRKNIENLKQLGFDTIEFSTNLLVRGRLNKFCLNEIGDISWPEHVAIFTIPFKIALYFNINLIIYGENSQFEYGGPESTLDNVILDRKWLEEFGGMNGLRVSDILLSDIFNNKDIEAYTYPTTEEIEKNKITGIFLGQFFEWDSEKNYEISKDNGFLSYENQLEGCYFNFEKIDNHQHGIHDYFKFLKYGFGRATDQLSYLVRRKKISRVEAIQKVRDYEGKYPSSYMGKPLNDILRKIDINEKEFKKICERFTNKKIFKTDQSGNITYDDDKNLIKINYDNI